MKTIHLKEGQLIENELRGTGEIIKAKGRTIIVKFKYMTTKWVLNSKNTEFDLNQL